MRLNPRRALRPISNDLESNPDQEEDSLLLIAYVVYLRFSGLSLRRTFRALKSFMSRSHVSIWRWVQRLGPVLGSFSTDPGVSIAYSSTRRW